MGFLFKTKFGPVEAAKKRMCDLPANKKLRARILKNYEPSRGCSKHILVRDLSCGFCRDHAEDVGDVLDEEDRGGLGKFSNN